VVGVCSPPRNSLTKTAFPRPFFLDASQFFPFSREARVRVLSSPGRKNDPFLLFPPPPPLGVLLVANSSIAKARPGFFFLSLLRKTEVFHAIPFPSLRGFFDFGSGIPALVPCAVPFSLSESRNNA